MAESTCAVYLIQKWLWHGYGGLESEKRENAGFIDVFLNQVSAETECQRLNREGLPTFDWYTLFARGHGQLRKLTSLSLHRLSSRLQSVDIAPPF